MEEKHIVTYNGQSVETKHLCPVTEEELAQYREEYYARPDIDIVKKQMRTVSGGGVMIDKITRYYFRDLMAKTLYSSTKWSVEDVFNSTDVCGIFKSKVLASPNVFKPNETMAKNIERSIALGGKGYAKIPTQFPIKAVDEVLNSYNINNVIYDFSCGWGARLIGALKHKIDYYGTDPNYLLCDRLNELANDWKSIIKNTNIIDIRNQGSEKKIDEWENKIGLAFSSPPYFDLEDYKIGNQSYSQGVTFEDWVNNYVKPTIDNIYDYLIDGGILALNIKDTTKPLVKVFTDYILEKNFEYIETIELKNIKRLKSTGGLTASTNEGIYIFKKIKN